MRCPSPLPTLLFDMAVHCGRCMRRGVNDWENGGALGVADHHSAAAKLFGAQRPTTTQSARRRVRTMSQIRP